MANNGEQSIAEANRSGKRSQHDRGCGRAFGSTAAKAGDEAGRFYDGG